MVLTVIGIVVAITAFGLLRTIVEAWYAGANASSSARLVTRNAISLDFFPAAQLCAAHSPDRRCCERVVGELVRRRVHHRAQLLSAVCNRCGELSRHVSRVPASAGRAQGFSA